MADLQLAAIQIGGQKFPVKDAVARKAVEEKRGKTDMDVYETDRFSFSDGVDRPFRYSGGLGGSYYWSDNPDWDASVAPSVGTSFVGSNDFGQLVFDSVQTVINGSYGPEIVSIPGLTATRTRGFFPTGDRLATTNKVPEIVRPLVEGKADEFTEWTLGGGDVSGLSLESHYVTAVDPPIHYWAVVRGGSLIGMKYAPEDSVSLVFVKSGWDWSGDFDLTATRRKVLYTGDESLGQMTDLGNGRYEYTGALSDASASTYPGEARDVKVTVDNDALDAIGAAIVEKGGSSVPMTPGDMPACIRSIGGGGGGMEFTGHRLVARTSSTNSGHYYVKLADGTEQNGRLPGDGELTVIDNVVFYDLRGDAPHAPSESGILLADAPAGGIIVSSQCFLSGTRVSLAGGSSKSIEDLSYDDELLVWDFDEGALSSARPFWLKERQTTDHFWINEFASGRVVKTTGVGYGHRFFNLDTRRFDPNTECVGHRVLAQDGASDVLVSARRVDTPCDYYNLNTERHINCFAEGVLAGCRLCNIYTVTKSLRYEKDGRPMRPLSDFAGLNGPWYEAARYSEQPMSAEELVKYANDRELVRKACV